MSRRALSLTMTSALALGLISVGPTRAQEVIPTNDIMPLSVAERMGLELRMSDLERKLREQQAQLDSQGEILRRQEALITQQAAELSRFRLSGLGLDSLRAGGPGEPIVTAPGQAPGPAADAPIVTAQQSAPVGQQPATQAAPGTPTTPVGEAPAEEPTTNLNAALPAENTGVLTRPGHFTIEPSLIYSLSTSDRLVYRGVQIVAGIQIGALEADQAQRNLGSATLTARTGITNRSEIEVQVPYVYRRDVITTLQQYQGAISSTQELNQAGLGDVEATLRYQLNGAGPKWPVIVANLRAKSDSGSNPYLVPRDQFGVADGLATGSGFWAVQPSLSFLFVSDPAVLFGNISYLHSFPRTFNRNIGGALLGKVTPGDSPGITGGFGFSLNPQFSFSLGYRHNYIFGTTTQLGGTTQRSTSLQVGSLLFGTSYAFNSNYSLNAQLEMGVTKDAPDITLTLRSPISF
jgi:hypothetical protein